MDRQSGDRERKEAYAHAMCGNCNKKITDTISERLSCGHHFHISCTLADGEPCSACLKADQERNRRMEALRQERNKRAAEQQITTKGDEVTGGYTTGFAESEFNAKALVPAVPYSRIASLGALLGSFVFIDKKLGQLWPTWANVYKQYTKEFRSAAGIIALIALYRTFKR